MTVVSRLEGGGREGVVAGVGGGWVWGLGLWGLWLLLLGVVVVGVVGVGGWLGGLGGLGVVLGVVRASVSAQEAEVQRLKDERERWNDETFIMTQARERLYYVMPGEVSYLVIDDRTEAAKADATAAVSAEVTESKGDWMRTLLDSVMTAGLAPAPTAPAEVPAGAPSGVGDR